MSLLLALVAALSLQASAQSDGPVITGAGQGEAVVADQRRREAIAYAYALPEGAPSGDYPLVAWCEAMVTGHANLGETLTDADDLDQDLIRLGRLEAADFRSALRAADGRATAQQRAAAAAAVETAAGYWAPAMAETDEAARSRAFGLFFGLPGRCEHAARRIRDNITTPPATPAEVGIDEAALVRRPAPTPESAAAPAEAEPEAPAEPAAEPEDTRSLTERLNSTPGM